MEQRCSGRPRWSSPWLTLQSPDSPVRATEGRPGGCSLQCRWVPASRGRPVPPSLLPARWAVGRAVGLRQRLRGRRAGRALGTCCTTTASPGRAGCVTALPGSACVHVTRLVVRAGVRPRVLSTLPPAPTPASFCASLPGPPPPPGSLRRNPGPAGTCLLKESPALCILCSWLLHGSPGQDLPEHLSWFNLSTTTSFY